LFSREGSPGFADWEGRNAGVIGIGPVHLEWTVVDGAAVIAPSKDSLMTRIGDGRWSGI
jgi:hypothetical protein